MEIEKEEIIEIPVENPTNFIQKEFSLLYLFGGVLLVLLFLAVLSSNVYYSKKNKDKRLELNKVKAERIEKEEKEYRQNLMADPYINIESSKYFGIHQNRLREHRASAYQGRIYYLGKKGGLYYRSSKGTRIYL